MLLKLMHFMYKKERIIQRDLFYEFYKYEIALNRLLEFRDLTLSIICSLISLFYCYNSKLLPTIVWFGIYGISLLYWRYKHRTDVSQLYNSHYDIRTMYIQDWIVRHFVTFRSVISKSDWKKVKKADPSLYKELTVNQHEQCCYAYSLELARILKDVQLVYGAVRQTFLPNSGLCAHAVILKNGEIFDSLLLRSFKLEDYQKAFDLKIYQIWEYDEFSVQDFAKDVKYDFVEWCKFNNVESYEYF